MSQTFSPDSEFSPLETPRNPNANNSLSITALARFEFEAGKGNEGTKILMVEWEDDDLTRSPAGSWHVSWEGKKMVLPADEQTSENTRRFYFLLPPGVTIPPVVTLTYVPPPNSASTAKKPESVQINPLPAIYPAELGATARTAGKKGVLHTIWAKKRLQALEKEIREEFIKNPEGVALQMAIQEKEWIEANFGVSLQSSSQNQSVSSSSPTPSSSSSYPPTTPISPAGGRTLGEKLRGLRLETSEKDLAKRAEGQTGPKDANAGAHLLSPESPDVAVSSFNSFRDAPTTASDTRRVVAHHPPPSLQQAQRDGGEFGFMEPLKRTESTDSGDELFAKALSPRSPDLPRSPFSFSPQDTMLYVGTKET
ncbi:hypothetical protein VTN77DRAFT_6809 [Rasamsonia byssochlamydoides]|uniref:uncharacterized protein n=1 Tax=Rasamsonia byssochlamydoides TaxID=89139 RepID=UPI003742117A